MIHSLFIWNMFCFFPRTKICEKNMPLFIQKNIFRMQISDNKIEFQQSITTADEANQSCTVNRGTKLICSVYHMLSNFAANQILLEPRELNQNSTDFIVISRQQIPIHMKRNLINNVNT